MMCSTARCAEPGCGESPQGPHPEGYRRYSETTPRSLPAMLLSCLFRGGFDRLRQVDRISKEWCMASRQCVLGPNWCVGNHLGLERRADDLIQGRMNVDLVDLAEFARSHMHGSSQRAHGFVQDQIGDGLAQPSRSAICKQIGAGRIFDGSNALFLVDPQVWADLGVGVLVGHRHERVAVLRQVGSDKDQRPDLRGCLFRSCGDDYATEAVADHQGGVMEFIQRREYGVAIEVQADLVRRGWCTWTTRQIDSDNLVAIRLKFGADMPPDLGVFKCTVDQNDGGPFRGHRTGTDSQC